MNNLRELNKRHSGGRFDKVRDRITTRDDTFQLQNSAGIAPMISSVQTNMQNDLASPHARRLAAGEDEIDRLLEIAIRQAIHVGRVPVVDLSNTAGKRLELRHFFRPRRLKCVRQSPQVMLKDSVDHMYVVEDAEHDRGILVGQPAEILTNNIVETAIGPSFDSNKFGVRLTDHKRSPSTAEVTMHV